jgi:hypothetical protein
VIAVRPGIGLVIIEICRVIVGDARLFVVSGGPCPRVIGVAALLVTFILNRRHWFAPGGVTESNNGRAMQVMRHANAN